MENFQSKNSDQPEANPFSFFSALFIMVFISNGFTCYPRHHENLCLTKRYGAEI
jgi:hypothetical protein